MTARSTRQYESAPLVLRDSYGGRLNVSKMFFALGCFNHGRCPFCNSELRLNVFYKTSERGGRESQSLTTTLRCTNRPCHKTVSPFVGNIWASVNDRPLFLFVVEGFLGRCTVKWMSEVTQSSEETISKYIKIIKTHFTLKPRKKSARRSLVEETALFKLTSLTSSGGSTTSGDS